MKAEDSQWIPKKIPIDRLLFATFLKGVIEKLKLLTDAEFAELEFPPD